MQVCCLRALLLAIAMPLAICAQEKGIEPDWDIRPVLKEIAAHAQRMVPVLEQIDAKEMAKNGAPDTYITQLNESKVQAKALATEAESKMEFGSPARPARVPLSIFKVSIPGPAVSMYNP